MCIFRSLHVLLIVFGAAVGLAAATEPMSRPSPTSFRQAPASYSPGGRDGSFDLPVGEDVGDQLNVPASGSVSHRKLGPVPGKIFRYVENLIRRHDADKDGVLDEQEWRGVAGNPQEADLDHDGMITSDELTQRIVVYGRHRSLRLAPPATRGGRLATDSDASTSTGLAGPDEPNGPTAGLDQFGPLPPQVEIATESDGTPDAERARELARRSRKFFIPRNRLPAGIASWFIDRDADGDGQITMREFTAKWSPELAAEFTGYDRNGDGVITATESVSSEAKAKPTKGNDQVEQATSQR